jgi:hypothetical protein
MIDFDTVLPAESVEGEYFTIATKKAGDILKVGKQHACFYGTLKEAKNCFYNIICDHYQHKVDFEETDFEIGDTKFTHDSTLDQLVLAYEARF